MLRLGMLVAILWFEAYASLGCTLVVSSREAMPRGRVISIKLSARHGAIEFLRPIPVGWTIVIDNDPSWNTTLTGQAVVGAAALESSALSGFITLLPEPGFSCSTMGGDGPLRLVLGLESDGFGKTYTIQGTALRLVDDRR